MSNILDIKERVALITGAGQGVGRQAALHFAANNAGGVVVNDYHLARAEAVVEEIKAMGGKAIALQADITDLGAVADMTRKAEDAFGRIDILVNNAGNAGPTLNVADIKQFWDTTPEEWNHWLGTNFFGVLNCCKAVLPGMMKRHYGRVVTVISDAGRVGEPHLAVYSGAKAASAGFIV